MRKLEDMCVVCNDHDKPSCGYEVRKLQRKCPYNDFIERGYDLAEKDILSKFTKEHLEGLKWIKNAGISTQPIPYHKYCKDLYKVLEELLKEKYDIQGDTSI